MLDAALALRPSNEVLTAYWTRTLNLFVGENLTVTLSDGRTRTGKLLLDARLDIGQAIPINIPLGQIRQLEAL